MLAGPLHVAVFAVISLVSSSFLVLRHMHIASYRRLFACLQGYRTLLSSPWFLLFLRLFSFLFTRTLHLTDHWCMLAGLQSVAVFALVSLCFFVFSLSCSHAHCILPKTGACLQRHKTSLQSSLVSSSFSFFCCMAWLLYVQRVRHMHTASY